jgi:Phage tail assembly chaperone, TAC
MLLSKSSLLAAARHVQEVTLPRELGSVHVRALTIAEMERFSKSQKTEGETAGANERLILATVCDESGVPLFDPASAEDLTAVGNLPFDVALAIVKAAAKANALDEGSVEDAQKN